MEDDTKPRVKKYRRTQATAFKRMGEEMTAFLSKVKEKNYTEREVEEAIHRMKVVDRIKRRNLDTIDSEIVIESNNTLKVINESYKRKFFVGNILRQLLP